MARISPRAERRVNGGGNNKLASSPTAEHGQSAGARAVINAAARFDGDYVIRYVRERMTYDARGALS